MFRNIITSLMLLLGLTLMIMGIIKGNDLIEIKGLIWIAIGWASDNNRILEKR